MAGSLLTLVTLYRLKKTTTSSNGTTTMTTYHRLLTGLCLYDLLMSTALAFGPLPAPQEIQAYGYRGAHGSVQTCTAQGMYAHEMIYIYFAKIWFLTLTSRSRYVQAL